MLKLLFTVCRANINLLLLFFCVSVKFSCKIILHEFISKIVLSRLRLKIGAILVHFGTVWIKIVSLICP